MGKDTIIWCCHECGRVYEADVLKCIFCGTSIPPEKLKKQQEKEQQEQEQP